MGGVGVTSVGRASEEGQGAAVGGARLAWRRWVVVQGCRGGPHVLVDTYTGVPVVNPGPGALVSHLLGCPNSQYRRYRGCTCQY